MHICFKCSLCIPWLKKCPVIYKNGIDEISEKFCVAAISTSTDAAAAATPSERIGHNWHLSWVQTSTTDTQATTRRRGSIRGLFLAGPSHHYWQPPLRVTGSSLVTAMPSWLRLAPLGSRPPLLAHRPPLRVTASTHGTLNESTNVINQTGEPNPKDSAIAVSSFLVSVGAAGMTNTKYLSVTFVLVTMVSWGEIEFGPPPEYIGSDSRIKSKSAKLAQKQCEQNAKNRKKLEVSHASGSKNNARRGRQMDKILEHLPEDQELAISYGVPLKILAHLNDVIEKVFGSEHSGRVHGLGGNVCPSKAFGVFRNHNMNLGGEHLNPINEGDASSPNFKPFIPKFPSDPPDKPPPSNIPSKSFDPTIDEDPSNDDLEDDSDSEGSTSLDSDVDSDVHQEYIDVWIYSLGLDSQYILDIL
ncbi:hypothetical protein FXO38_10807 [Capsicum annuum]|nr:hypothetical protein FXO37_17154 [Capsicum annuum]KAF3663097.1 hypothetical protein FXO38_10807 [Capsicum annuum]